MSNTRREVIKTALGLGAATLAPTQLWAGALTGVHETTREEWLAPFVTTKAASGTLLLYRFADPIYVLMKPVKWVPDSQSPKGMATVDVPVGFVTDFASVPQVFWSLLPKDGNYTFAAILHDYLYWVQDREREEADKVLQVVMKEFNVDFATMNAIYYAVRAGGGGAWKANADIKAKGEKRRLRKFPDKPQVTWEDWKKEPDVFDP